MAKGIKVDFKEFQEFQEKIEQLNDEEIDKFMRKATNKVAQRFYRRMIDDTPRKTGTLRDGWIMQGKVDKTPFSYKADVTNVVEYASYVESGHRKSNHRGWVKGQFFQKRGEELTEAEAPKFVGKELKKFLRSIE